MDFTPRYPWGHSYTNVCRQCHFTAITPQPKVRCDNCWGTHLTVRPVQWRLSRGILIRPGNPNMKRRPRPSGVGFTAYDPDEALSVATRKYLRASEREQVKATEAMRRAQDFYVRKLV